MDNGKRASNSFHPEAFQYRTQLLACLVGRADLSDIVLTPRCGLVQLSTLTNRSELE
jgi:hypothetical protein